MRSPGVLTRLRAVNATKDGPSCQSRAVHVAPDSYPEVLNVLLRKGFPRQAKGVTGRGWHSEAA
jgi:hypothetical protein